MSNFVSVNILDLAEVLGEDKVKSILSDFTCAKNSEIENFVREKALEFANKKMSVTYLVIDENEDICAIFTLTHKAIEIKDSVLASNTARKKIQRYAELDKSFDGYMLSAFLIAQFGKNDVSKAKISGDELMDLTFEALREIQHDIGGSVVYLECEDKDKLLSFYSSSQNGFKKFGERYSERESVKYIRLFRFV